MPNLNIVGHSFELQTFTLAESSKQVILDESAAILKLFLEREAGVRTHSSATIDYPNLADISAAGFLTDAAAYVANRVQSIDGLPTVQIVVLTTYSDIVGASFEAAGYRTIPIIMPAGPDHTAAFVLATRNPDSNLRTLYVEAVNEADEKISPSFALKLTVNGELRGGAYGSIHEYRNKHYAYLSMMAVAPGLPRGSGTALMKELLRFLRDQGVKTIHLGTQTAGRFYEKVGFKVEHRLVRNLRVRDEEGRKVLDDLVMLSMEI